MPVAEINRAALARECGYTPAQISRVLSGNRTPSLKLARLMAEALDMELGEFDTWLQDEIRGDHNQTN